jgi:DNA-3-methyladenine glycosylase II
VVSTTTTDAPNLNPTSILRLAEQGVEEHLQKPAGLSRAKASSIVALATAFEKGELTEDFFIAPTSTEADIRNALLPIKGIGPWTCDMFLMFYLEKGNVMPLGDLGVRKGIAKFFTLTGRGPKQSLCQVKDKDVMERTLAPFEPYQSLVAYYMWVVADTKDFYREEDKSGHTLEVDASQKEVKTKRKRKS